MVGEFGGDPEMPVVVRAREEALRAALVDKRIERFDVLEAGAEGQPGVAGGALAGRQGAELEAGAAIHRALGDGIAAELAVLGVLPGAVLAVDLFLAGGPLREP